MIDLEVPVEGVARDALDALLSSDQSPPEPMMLSDLARFSDRDRDRTRADHAERMATRDLG